MFHRQFVQSITDNEKVVFEGPISEINDHDISSYSEASKNSKKDLFCSSDLTILEIFEENQFTEYKHYAGIDKSSGVILMTVGFKPLTCHQIAQMLEKKPSKIGFFNIHYSLFDLDSTDLKTRAKKVVKNKHGKLEESINLMDGAKTEQDQYLFTVVTRTIGNTYLDILILPVPNFTLNSIFKMHGIKIATDTVLENLSGYNLYNVISKFDEKVRKLEHKIGIIMQKKDDLDETQMLSHSQLTPEMEIFLSKIGTKIELSHFKGYYGGLDIVHGSTGSHSYYSEYKNNQIMFHVSSMLPESDLTDKNMLKKKLLYNDNILIILQERGAQFYPAMVPHCRAKAFILVEFVDVEMSLVSISAVYLDGIRMPSPSISESLISYQDPKFTQFFLKKLINFNYLNDFCQLAQKHGTSYDNKLVILVNQLIINSINITSIDQEHADKTISKSKKMMDKLRLPHSVKKSEFSSSKTKSSVTNTSSRPTKIDINSSNNTSRKYSRKSSPLDKEKYSNKFFTASNTNSDSMVDSPTRSRVDMIPNSQHKKKNSSASSRNNEPILFPAKSYTFSNVMDKTAVDLRSKLGKKNKPLKKDSNFKKTPQVRSLDKNSSNRNTSILSGLNKNSSNKNSFNKKNPNKNGLDAEDKHFSTNISINDSESNSGDLNDLDGYCKELNYLYQINDVEQRLDAFISHMQKFNTE